MDFFGIAIDRGWMLQCSRDSFYLVTMKTRRVALLVWLAGVSWAGAQMSQAINGGPSSTTQTYGAGPSTPSQMFQTPPKPTGQTTALTPNSTAKPAAPADSDTTTVPSLTGNVPAVPAPGSTPANSPYTGGDLSNIRMPETMEQIDNQRKLTKGDQFVFQVLEDHDKPQILFVDERGVINKIPYLPKAELPNITGNTLYEVANVLKGMLEDPKQVPPDPEQTAEDAKYGLYKKATVLLAFYQGTGTRGHVDVFGEVFKQGHVDVPADSVLTLYQAIQLAGGFKDTADREHVLLLHQDRTDPSKVTITQQKIDFQKFFDGQAREPGELVEPGDVVKVPSKTEGGVEGIKVVGEVGTQTVLPPPTNSSPVLLSDVMIKVGWTPWSIHKVHLIRFVDGEKTDTIYDVDEVLVKGNKKKDVFLQPGDIVRVDKSWFSTGS